MAQDSVEETGITKQIKYPIWVHGEKGPTCPCGKETFVSFYIKPECPVLICMLHNHEQGLYWNLPLIKPVDWPKLCDINIIFNDDNLC